MAGYWGPGSACNSDAVEACHARSAASGCRSVRIGAGCGAVSAVHELGTAKAAVASLTCGPVSAPLYTRACAQAEAADASARVGASATEKTGGTCCRETETGFEQMACFGGVAAGPHKERLDNHGRLYQRRGQFAAASRVLQQRRVTWLQTVTRSHVIMYRVHLGAYVAVSSSG